MRLLCWYASELRRRVILEMTGRVGPSQLSIVEERCMHPEAARTRHGNKFANWTKCSSCGERLSYRALTTEERESGSPEKAVVSATTSKQTCRMCGMSIPRGTMAAQAGGAWRHVDCLVDQATAKDEKKPKKLTAVRAKWDGTCDTCRATWSAGHMIAHNGTGWCHLKCAMPVQDAWEEKSASSTEEEGKPIPASRKTKS